MIVAMKRVELLCLKEDKDELLKLFQKSAKAMFIKPDKTGNMIEKPLNKSTKDCDKIKDILINLKKFAQDKNSYEDQVRSSADDLLNLSKEYLDLQENISKCFLKIENIKSIRENNSKEIKKLKPWTFLDFSIKNLDDNNYTWSITAIISRKHLNDLVKNLNKIGVSYKENYFEGKNGEVAALLIVCCKPDMAYVKEALDTCEYSEVVFDNIEDKNVTIPEELERLEKYSKYLNDQLKEEKCKLQKFSQKSKELKILYEQLKAKEIRDNTACLETDQAVYFEAWIKAQDEKSFKSIVENSNIPCDVEFFDPKDGDIVPTVTKNSRFVKPFEVITDMFSVPSYREMDPNPIMSFWYWLIFGMMVGDAGYGLIMFIAGFLFKKVSKPKGSAEQIINILMLSSISTIFWGIMFGSYFSIESEYIKPVLFSPLRNSMEMMKFSLLIGVLHISSGVLFKAIELIKNGKFAEAIFDHISWILIIDGLCLCTFSPKLGFYISILGVAIVVITGGRKKKNIFGKITGGISSLYGITSYLSDVLSYSRILALGLATCVVAMVMNTLAAMLPKSFIGIVFSILIYAVGHIFNLALGLLSAYVHDSRLQYIEFFNKFYDGGGKAFTPLAFDTDYIELDK